MGRGFKTQLRVAVAHHDLPLAPNAQSAHDTDASQSYRGCFFRCCKCKSKKS